MAFDSDGRHLLPSDPRRHVMVFSLCVVCCLTFQACTNDNGEIGSYWYRPDMHVQPSFKHHRDPLPPVDGTVPTEGYETLVKDSLSATRLQNPVVPDELNADTAKFLFETYCSPCHGLGAKGDGLVAPKFQQPPDLTTATYRRTSDGYFYFVMQRGRLVMPSYAEAVKARERWLIVNHVRTLQRR